MDLISVIVPVYNVEKYLDRCVQSIVNQTYQNLEIILVDDGSPDGCPAMCDAWAEKDNRIRVIHKENGGLSDARNAGMEIANGEYIAFVDSDDWVSPDYIDAMYQAIRNTGGEIAACDVVISYGDIEPAVSAQGAALRVCNAEEAIGDILQGKGFRAVAWNKLYKKSLLENEQYPVGKYHEDEFFTYRILAKARKLVYVDCALYAYFQRPGSIMNSVSIKHLDALDAYLERLAFLKKKYPQLYAKDKFVFCASCVGFYQYADRNCTPDAARMQEKIKRCRKKVHFNVQDFRQATIRQLVYVLGSAISIDVFCELLNARNREKKDG